MYRAEWGKGGATESVPALFAFCPLGTNFLLHHPACTIHTNSSIYMRMDLRSSAKHRAGHSSVMWVGLRLHFSISMTSIFFSCAQ